MSDIDSIDNDLDDCEELFQKEAQYSCSQDFSDLSDDEQDLANPRSS